MLYLKVHISHKSHSTEQPDYILIYEYVICNSTLYLIQLFELAKYKDAKVKLPLH